MPATTETKDRSSDGTRNSAYKLHDKPGLPLRPMRIICIGAYLGIRLPMVTENVELVIYEKNADVGGTW